ncbi:MULTISPECIES: oligogalacturonate-specific porin KdgM family protein [Vibrio]|uniref:Porin n=1 Tax=Vibrio casei TaxID=673372 RepID=A0A368LI65_9VIBR|nr:MULTISPECIES: oligogalacturonate-specific porin KdgM family protein [Vibrio]RCS70388.1 porin [Vibrio casei]SJN20491.1 N-acetylneuraminic acid outer membrane channel protein NanC [Vibrio casei]HBV77062.1 porin [Vibrio sp.]
MKKILSLSLLAVAITSTSVFATTINIRHEWKPEFGDKEQGNADRIAVSHRFANGIGFEVEAKWKSNNEAAFSNLSGNGQQANLSYRYKLSESFTLTPQAKLETSEKGANYQGNLTLGYKVNDDVSTSIRYRYNYFNGKDATIDNNHYNRITLAASYSGVQNFGFGASTDYTFRQEGTVQYGTSKQGISEINLTAEYKGFESGWRPFIEVGVTPEYKYKTDDERDDWRPRYRVGMKYSY